MPNHVTTVCTVTGSPADVERFSMHIYEEECRGQKRKVLAFETIVPMPQSVKDTVRPMFDEQAPDGCPPDHCGDAHVDMYVQCILNSRGFGRHTFIGFRWLPETVQTWGELRAWLDATAPSAAFWAKRVLLCAAETGHPGWYEWSITNWGTKWGAYQYKERTYIIGKSTAVLTFEFQTAWSFPRPIFRKLVELYPAMTFHVESIDEGGPEFVGTFSSAEQRYDEVSHDRNRYRYVYGEDPPEDDPFEGEESDEETEDPETGT